MHSINRNRNAGFIYMEGAFYNDTHDPCACDLSAPIIDFLAKRQQGYQQPQYTHSEGCLPAEESEETVIEEVEYRTEDMRAVTFAQLNLRVGASETDYCLLHQGCCEHALVVTDVRRVSACDPQWKAAYPLLVYQVPLPLKSCCICNMPAVAKVTYNDRFAPECPAFWCEDCYVDLHYDEEMRCIDSEHRALPYCTW
ncbi:hypothetical protein MMC07_000432 [Pseudocyphellaria aurata]|nr:hypothetical protein [Pseudocyphellaria aurata]